MSRTLKLRRTPRSEDAILCELCSHNDFALIRPFMFRDILIGDTVSVSVSPYYSKLKINKRVYYFFRETGEFDGVSYPVTSSGRSSGRGGAQPSYSCVPPI